ncbi:serine/threonine-protein kinase [Streptomyces sp. NPDC060194]|uniref:serine/threonine-protein kinase n=1 Tax=Streptomyces sp. NPDC060194 TaxID=3347069 RepID=UPI00364B07E9
MSLPSPLDADYTLLRPLPAAGGQADLYEVRDRAGRARVVKVYRFGTRADRQVWDRLRYLDHPALMRILDKGGLPDGRDYEVMPFMSGGTGEDRSRMAPDDLAGLLRRLASGINQLHLSEIVHRDIKPANLLFADRTGSDAVLADYGISRVLDAGAHTRWMTHGYAPPEAYDGGRATPAYDWWALGMTVLRLATGRGPFEGLPDGRVIDLVRSADVPLDGLDPGLAPLVRGLLSRDPAARWDRERVVDWLDGAGGGGRPTRKERATAADGPRAGGPELVLRGRTYRTREGLAAGIRELPVVLASEVFRADGALTASGRRLCRWLRELDARDAQDAVVRDRLADRVLPLGSGGPAELNELLRWLDQDGPPVAAGGPLDVERLVRLCVEAATEPGGAAFETVREWYDARTLNQFAGFAPLSGLGGVRTAWGERVGRWTRQVWASRAPQELLPAKGRSGALPLLLLSVLPYPEAGDALAAHARAVPWPHSASPDWYGSMVNGLGGRDAPEGLVVRAAAGPSATAERGRKEAQARERAERAERARRAEEEIRDRARDAERAEARRQAAEREATAERARAAAAEKARAASEERARDGAAGEFAFAGTAHRTTAELAATVRKHAKEAVAELLPGAPGTRPPAMWRRLRAWTERLPRLTAAQHADRPLVFGTLLTDASAPEVKLLRLLHWLDPAGAAVVKGRHITTAGLVTSCTQVLSGKAGKGSAARQTVGAVLQDGVLSALGDFPALRTLRGAEQRVAKVREARALAVGELAFAPGTVADAEFRAAALLFALDDEAARAALAREAWRVPARGGPAAEAFERLVRRSGPHGLVIRAAYAAKVPDAGTAAASGTAAAGKPAAGKAGPAQPVPKEAAAAKQPAQGKPAAQQPAVKKPAGPPEHPPARQVARVPRPSVPPRPRHAPPPPEPAPESESVLRRALARWRDYLNDV